MLVSEAGKLIDDNLTQPENAFTPMEATVFPRVTLVRFVHPIKS